MLYFFFKLKQLLTSGVRTNGELSRRGSTGALSEKSDARRISTPTSRVLVDELQGQGLKNIEYIDGNLYKGHLFRGSSVIFIFFDVSLTIRNQNLYKTVNSRIPDRKDHSFLGTVYRRWRGNLKEKHCIFIVCEPLASSLF